MEQYDIIIVGGGVVGAVAALALANNTSLKIAILESQPVITAWDAKKYGFRVSAMSLASKKILQKLQVWESICDKRISPYHEMHVWDEMGNGAIHFDCASVNEAALGCIIEDEVTRVSLMEKIIQHPKIHAISPVKLLGLNHCNDRVELQAEEKTYSASLLIAADGANSWVRTQAFMDAKIYDYQQTAIVSMVQTELSHQSTAWQRFLTTGPLAFLPLQDKNQSSIVWSVSHDLAKELLLLHDEQFCHRLGEAIEYKLGNILHTSKRYSFPLKMLHVKNYIKDRIVFIGDAAHCIHPLAGQGLNMGLLDAAALTEIIIDAVQKGRDYSQSYVLRRYERWRKSDNATMLTAVDLLKKFFNNPNTLVKNLRNTGLSFTNRLSFIKNYFMNYALGNRGDLPVMARD